MGHISKHHSKQEWESNNRKDGRIHFSVIRITISIDDHLEGHRKVIISKMGWRLESMIYDLIHLRPHYISILLQLCNDIEDFSLIDEWDPAEPLEDHII